jgi:crossover junction endodeoxyribonuclease RusA
VIRFSVPGRPQPKGSIRAVPHATTGRIMMLGANPKGKAHQTAIAWAAKAAGVRPASAGASVAVELVFWLLRPKAHWLKSGVLRDGAPIYPAQRPDVDKLARLVLDALTGIAYEDDSQVVQLSARKEFALELEHTDIAIRRAA